MPPSESATLSPPVVRLVPEASLSWTVIVEVEAPSATIEVGLAVIVEVVAGGRAGAGRRAGGEGDRRVVR